LVRSVPSVNTLRFKTVIFSSTDLSFTHQAFRDGCIIIGRMGKIALNTIQWTNFEHKHGYIRLKTKICVCVFVDVRLAYLSNDLSKNRHKRGVCKLFYFKTLKVSYEIVHYFLCDNESISQRLNWVSPLLSCERISFISSVGQIYLISLRNNTDIFQSIFTFSSMHISYVCFLSGNFGLSQ
jgi:hypothetical protein